MRGLATAFLIVTISLPPTQLEGQVGPLTDRQITQLDSTLTAVREANDAVGVQFAVGIDDQVVWVGVAGHADLEHDVPVTPETLFRTASISKWFTATAAMRLSEQGTLDLDAPVQSYCTRYPAKRWPLTVRHLLSHRGGVRHYWGSNDEPRGTREQRELLAERTNTEREGWLRRYSDVLRPVEVFAGDSLLFEPGTRYHYSSHGYRLLGCAMRGAARRGYSELMRELVFGPAGMVKTREDDAWAVIPHRASGYVHRGDRLFRSAFRDVSENLPAGGHLSTAADLVRFALAWNRGVLLDEQSREAMTARPPGTPPDGNYYGYGVQVVDRDGLQILNHGGGQNGTRTALVLAPEHGVAIATMTNDESIGPGLMQFVDRALDVMLPLAGSSPDR